MWFFVVVDNFLLLVTVLWCIFNVDSHAVFVSAATANALAVVPADVNLKCGMNERVNEPVRVH